MSVIFHGVETIDITKMILHARHWTLLLLLGLATTASSIKCTRRMDGVAMQPLQLDGKFRIVIATLNSTEIVDQYMPGVKYTVTIEGEKTAYGPLKFTRFMLTAESKDDNADVGTFDLADEILTQFSDKCPATVVERNQVPKENVTAFWTSPPEDSGCISIRATVVENDENWYNDEGALARTVCQNPKAEQDNPGVVLDKCCACDEAKYEVTFEGLWSRNTHPKDFPSKGWLIRFSDVIGASHTSDYRFWQIDDLASKGLQQVAELGSTRELESELKRESANIRTIIKARGITYPNVTGKTFAVFRVDRQHHLMSLVSMIVPSPDWIVGVSGLELCLANCSWIEHKELNLYPVDAGTDSGITYTSLDSPTDPHEPVRVITTSYPNDTRSPFFDLSGHDMKPMAKLHLNRQRLYEKTCINVVASGTNEGGEEPPKRDKPKACRTTQWSEWSECPDTCTQLKQRSYQNQSAAIAHNCSELLTDRKPCSSNPKCLGNGNQLSWDSEECSLAEWSEWSECSQPCDGHQKRVRKFKYKRFQKKCRVLPDPPRFQETVDCSDTCTSPEYERDDGSENQSDGSDETTESALPPVAMGVTREWMQKCQSDMFTEWSDWSPCSSSCGPGVSSRIREPINDSYTALDDCKTEAHNCTAEIVSCDYSKRDAIEICNEPLLTGECREHYRRNYYDKKTNTCRSFVWTGCRANRNNFATIEECRKVCLEDAKEMANMKNFKVAISSVLSYHMPQNQRRPKTKRAKWNDDDDRINGIAAGSLVTRSDERHHYGRSRRVDCRFSEWSEWSRCENCHDYTYQTRSILVHAANGGRRCPTKLIRKRRCMTLTRCSGEMARRRKRFRERGSDCESKHWSPWSRCSATCGESLRHRTRNSEIQEHDSHRKRCKKLVEFQKCFMPGCP